MRPDPSDLSPEAQAQRPAVGEPATVTPAEAHALARAAERALSVLAWLNGTAFASQAKRERVLGADLAQQAKNAQAGLWRAGGPFRDRAGRVADRLLMHNAPPTPAESEALQVAADVLAGDASGLSPSAGAEAWEGVAALLRRLGVPTPDPAEA